MIDSYIPVKRQGKLSVQVVEQIIDLIVKGKLSDGDQLPPERELCDTFGVSRTVIREAISVLETKGLLETQVGSGTYIRKITSEDIVDSLGLYISTQNSSLSMLQLLEVRRIFETRVAQLAAENATEDDIKELEEIVSDMSQLFSDPAAFAKKDLDFHLGLAHASGNPLFGILLEPITDMMLEFIYVSSNLPNTPSEAYEHHRTILDAVIAHDGEKAFSAMVDHLQQTERVTSKAFQVLRTEKSVKKN